MSTFEIKAETVNPYDEDDVQEVEVIITCDEEIGPRKAMGILKVLNPSVANYLQNVEVTELSE